MAHVCCKHAPQSQSSSLAQDIGAQPLTPTAAGSQRVSGGQMPPASQRSS
jgi:hypothetical protein